MLKLISISILFALWCTDYASSQCKQRDVAVVIEVPFGDRSAAEHAKNFVEELKMKLNPSPKCTKLAIIFSWTRASEIINLGCDYGICYRSGLLAIDRIVRTVPRITRPNQKQSLSASIRLATEQLYDVKRQGAREKAEKILVLVLSSPPNKNVPATEEEVKDYHDMRIKIVAVGVGAGRKENLAEIVVFDNLKLNYENFGDLVEVGVPRISKIITGQAADRLGFAGSARGMPGVAPLQESIQDASRVAKLVEDQKDTCKNIVDIAFIMDSSGSVRKHYLDEKFFVQRIASRFEIIEAGSHGGVILFSSHGYIKTVIKFTDFLTTRSFNEAVGLLPFYGYMTRIDTALKLAHTELYTAEGRARPNVRKLLFLITDGRQNPDFENGKRLDPAKEAENLHLSGVQVYAVGIGSKVNHTELSLITKDKSKVYMASDFKELVSDAFVSKVSKRLCADAGMLPTVTVTMKPFTKPANIKKPCNKTASDCGCKTCGCGCGCCEQKSPVYINIFKGANSKNYLMQGAHVSQNGGSNSLGSLGFREIRSSPSANSTALKEMSSGEITSLIKDLLPYQQQFTRGLEELLRRVLAKETKKRRRRDLSQTAKN